MLYDHDKRNSINLLALLFESLFTGEIYTCCCEAALLIMWIYLQDSEGNQPGGGAGFSSCRTRDKYHILDRPLRHIGKENNRHLSLCNCGYGGGRGSGP